MTAISFRFRRLLQLLLAAGLLAFPYQAFNAAPDSLSPVNSLPRFALVIGNSRYSEAPLKNPGNDADAIAEQLRKMGFAVTLKLDAGRMEMVDAIRSFGNALAQQKGVGLFYFAGHGVQLAWRNYLIPVDAVIEEVSEIRAKAVDVATLLQGLTKAGNPMNVVILDACRDNPFGKARVEQKGLSQQDAPPGTLLAYATSPGNTAADGGGTNGLYTEYLLREMRAREAKIEDIFKRVRLNVRRQSQGRQIPWESTSLEEDFYFMPPAQIRKLAPEEIERQFEEELGIWEKIRGAKEAAPLENYLRRFPSGRFSELAQFRLDRLLAQQAEKPVQVASVAPPPAATVAPVLAPIVPKPAASASVETVAPKPAAPALVEPSAPKPPAPVAPSQITSVVPEALAPIASKPVASVAPIHVASIAPNPFSRGTAKANADYKLGDSYSYRTVDTLTKLESRQPTETVTAVTDFEITFNSGRRVIDLLGNDIKSPNARILTPRQFFPAEYAIGKKWTTRYRIKRISDGVEDVAEIDFKIVGREKITVPAGTFDAFKIEGRGYLVSAGSHQAITIWVAPDVVRRPVASEFVAHNRSRYFITDRDELVAYKQGD